jgi:hypothetical protein
MSDAFITGCGLVLIATGVGLGMTVMRRAQAAAPPSEVHSYESGELPVLGAPELLVLTKTDGLRAAIQSKCGFSAEHFERTVMPVLNAYAEFVQQLPASESHHHAQPGGLLIHGLEVAGFALTFRRGQILVWSKYSNDLKIRQFPGRAVSTTHCG